MIEVATKAGTNELHGTLYEFGNDVLNGRNFSPHASKLKRNSTVAVGRCGFQAL